MKTVCASFEIVTPMFIGSSDPTKPEGVRSSSVKGALRFWWRALNWARMSGASDTEKLRNLHQEESRLFGVSAGDKSGGQGVFMLQVRDTSQRAVQQPFGHGFDAGILYLLGMGLGSFKDGNHCTRAALPAVPGKGFEVKLLFRPKTPLDDVRAVTAALQVFGLLGALGSRARHGMGSVAMTSMQSSGLELDSWQAPDTPERYREQLGKLLKQPRTAAGLPPLSAFCQQTRLDLSCQHRDMPQLLALLGREQQAYRSYGNNGKVNGADSERNFIPDHDDMLTAANGNLVAKAPQRVAFGLPHNYFFSSTKAKVDVNYRPDDEEGRRASPLLLHVHRIGEQYVAVHTLLESRFLPEERPTVQIKPGKGRAVNVPVQVNWQVLHTYLDRFKKNTAWSPL